MISPWKEGCAATAGLLLAIVLSAGTVSSAFTAVPGGSLSCWEFHGNKDPDRYAIVEVRSPDEVLAYTPVDAREKLLHWVPLVAGPDRIHADAPFDLLCRLSQTRYLASLADAQLIRQGLYLIDTTAPVIAADDAIYLGTPVGNLVQFLRDKSGNAHLVTCLRDMRDGYGWEDCSVVNLAAAAHAPDLHRLSAADPPIQLLIAKGRYFSEERGCPEGDTLRRFELEFADENHDGYTDIIVTTTETSCDTRQETLSRRVFLATDHGFAEMK